MFRLHYFRPIVIVSSGLSFTACGLLIDSGTEPLPIGTEMAGSEEVSHGTAGTEPAGTEPAGTEPAGTEPAGTEPQGPSSQGLRWRAPNWQEQR